jgi:hypothetical protein
MSKLYEGAIAILESVRQEVNQQARAASASGVPWIAS